MKKTQLPTIFFFAYQLLISQVDKDIYQLNSINDLLTNEVKVIIDQNTKENQTVFLGEAVHYSGSDFLAKTEFVKYLVIEQGYKDIAFESDFFALLFDHNQRNLYSMWSKSNQCKELFDFLAKNKVTIWGFDNRIGTPYSHEHFTVKLSKFLITKDIKLDKKFTKLAKVIIKNEYKSSEILTNEEINYLEKYTLSLLSEKAVKNNKTWNQILESFKSVIKLYTIKDNNSDKKRIAIRDKQMAKNLNFLVKQNPNKKFIVWISNAHMSKSNGKLMLGQTMGHQFIQLNPNASYHIAVGSIRLPGRNEKAIIKSAKKNKSILSLLPSLKNNHFIDAKQITNKNGGLKNRIFNDMFIFNMESNKTELLNHFDALVLIAYGEEVKYYK
ncbi:MAG: erythromycin esterase family protein [Eudoraea sp.]|uniref:erythromycin esterase family protein n=1 Tax=Eudoraea sp. TaxID=1979955 RepID=UPI003C75CEA8